MDSMADLKPLTNVQSEILMVGALYKHPDLYISYGKSIRSKYDFSDEATRFFYNCFELMYTKFSQVFDEDKVNLFMSADTDRLNTYRKYKGWKTISEWIRFSDVKDFKNYYNTVKKYSLLREYDRNGFPTQKLLESPKFETWTAQDIYKIIRAKADKINTVISACEEAVVLTSGVEKEMKSLLITPEMGIDLPWRLLSDTFRGCRTKKVIFNGFLSNEGKTRNMMLLIAYIVLVRNEKFLLLSNEMDEKDLQHCLLTTVINNPWFQNLHGVHINKKEGEIVLGQYHDDEGNLIERKVDTNGYWAETENEYIDRLERTSSEYRSVLQVSRWIDEKREGKLFFKDVGDDYSDETLEMEFRKHRLIYDIKYCGYDTMKGYGIDDWQTLKQTATKIKEVMKAIDMFCWAVFQLTDDTVFTDVFAMSSNNIANSKGIKHVADALQLGKKIDKDDYYKYQYISSAKDWGEQIPQKLDENKTYFAIKVDKNRGGNKPVVLFEINLDYNTWIEVGTLIKSKASKPKKNKDKEEV